MQGFIDVSVLPVYKAVTEDRQRQLDCFLNHGSFAGLSVSPTFLPPSNSPLLTFFSFSGRRPSTASTLFYPALNTLSLLLQQIQHTTMFSSTRILSLLSAAALVYSHPVGHDHDHVERGSLLATFGIKDWAQPEGHPVAKLFQRQNTGAFNGDWSLKCLVYLPVY